MIGPANMKADLVAQVNALTSRALADPQLKARYNDLGATRWPTSPAEIKAFRCRGVKAVADHEGGRHQAGMNGLRLKNRGLALRVRATRGPMTGLRVTRLFIVGERWVTLSPMHPDGKRKGGKQ